MTMTVPQTILFLSIIAATTYLTRLLPFLLFPEHRKTPEYVVYLGRVLPYPIIGLLVVYSLKDVHLLKQPYGVPETIAIALIYLLHRWKKNTLLSIGAGTIAYILLLQLSSFPR